MLMAPICPDDASTTITQKINLTARFIDLWVNTRVMNRKSLSYNTIQDYIFRIAKDIRGCSIGELKAKLKAHYDALNYRPEATVANHKLHRGTNAQHAALRRTHDDYNRFLGSKFFNKEEFDIYWNKIGALLLLRKSINSSLNDSDYPQKLIKYCSADGNIYAASLGEQTYRNNPRFKRFATDNNLLFKPCKKIRQGGD